MRLLLRAEGHAAARLSRGPAANMYWTVAQMIAHHGVGGCDLNPGDLLGTGTISTPERAGFGSLMEIARGGAEPITLPTGKVRTFLADDDTLAPSERAEAPGRVPIRFGPCIGTVSPARAA